MFKILKNSWALFTGIGIMMIAHGLQSNLMGVRSVIENFNVVTTGIFMSGYFVGYFIGSQTTPILVSKVGHIRVFAAFASMASLSVLIVVVFVNPYIWTIARFITGLSLVSCYIVAESWLNDRATNKNRGQLLSAYMIILFTGLGIGMLLLNVGNPEKFEPFILVSLLMSIALVPILLTKRKAPKFKKIGVISMKELYKISPLGTVSSFCTGAIHSALFSLAAVYAATVKFTILEISILLFIINMSAVFSTGPIGFLSDKYDRRLIIIISSLGSAILAFIAIFISNHYLTTFWNLNYESVLGNGKLIFFIILGLYASLSLPLFSLNLAHTNDYVSKEKFVAAGGGLQLIFGIGAIGGPILCSLLMKLIGVNGFFMFLIMFHIIICIFGFWRMTRRVTEDNPDSTFTPLPASITPAGLELDPDVPVDMENKNPTKEN